MDDIECSVAEAGDILRRTLKSMGYDDSTAELGVWSSLWLERRGHYGVQELIVYMTLVHRRPFDQLKPRLHDEYGVTGICPFMLASFICSNADLLLKESAGSLGAPSSPNLFAASVADLLALSGKSLRIRHQHYSCLYAKDGIRFEAEEFGAWSMPSGGDENGPMLLEVTDDQASSLRNVERIRLPKVRMGANRILRLS